MNKRLLLTLGLILVPGYLLALNDYNPQNNWVSFATDAPPVLMYITDSQGRRAGADPTVALDQYGRQGTNGSGLEEIPNSVVLQDNETNPTTGLPKDNTTWEVMIPDGGTNNYTVNLVGISDGINKLIIGTGLVNTKSHTSQAITILTSTGVTQLINVAVNPTEKSIVFTPVVNSDSLLNDLKSACAQNLIEKSICIFLEMKATHIQDALNKHHYREAGELLRSFLCNLGQLQAEGDDKRDCHASIQEPALTVLISGAKALLKSLPSEDQ